MQVSTSRTHVRFVPLFSNLLFLAHTNSRFTAAHDDNHQEQWYEAATYRPQGTTVRALSAMHLVDGGGVRCVESECAHRICTIRRPWILSVTFELSFAAHAATNGRLLGPAFARFAVCLAFRLSFPQYMMPWGSCIPTEISCALHR